MKGGVGTLGARAIGSVKGDAGSQCSFSLSLSLSLRERGNKITSPTSDPPRPKRLVLGRSALLLYRGKKEGKRTRPKKLKFSRRKLLPCLRCAAYTSQAPSFNQFYRLPDSSARDYCDSLDFSLSGRRKREGARGKRERKRERPGKEIGKCRLGRASNIDTHNPTWNLIA